MSAVIDADPREFESLLTASHDRPVLVDFSASWCGPCKAMAPELDGFADEHENELTVAKVDIDQAPSVAPLAMQPGMMSKSQIADWVAQHMPRREPVQQDPSRPQVDLNW
jgi:thioredoxin 1